MTPETNALIPVGIAALCFLLAFLYGRHRRALALRRRVAESFGQTPAEPERPRAMTREFWELLRAGEPAGQCIDDATWNDLDMDDVFARIVSHPALRDLPFILETPNELPGYAEEIKRLRALQQ